MNIYQVIPTGDWGEDWYFKFCIKQKEGQHTIFNPWSLTVTEIHEDNFSLPGNSVIYLE